MYHLAYYFLQSREASEEAVLDVFTNLWHKREKLSNVTDPIRYLYSSVKNQALHYLRRGLADKRDNLSLYEIELLPDPTSPEKSLIDKEQQQLVQKAIDSLPPKCKEVFRLALDDKLKHREIAELMGISEKTVDNHIAKAYQRIAESVRHQYRYLKLNAILLLCILGLKICGNT